MIWIWIISLVVKLLLAYLMPMTTDETYYWVWSLHPQLSYYDHPPFVAWLFWLGHLFQGWGNAVRWPAVLMAHCTILIWYFIWKNFISSDLQRFSWWFYLALFTPLIGFGSLILTPDLPVLFFWSLGLYFFFKIFRDQKPFDYFMLGASLGLGFCSKYHIVLFPLIAVIYVTVEKKWKEVSFSKLLITVFSGLLFCLPVIFWNFQNDFISFKFQLKHGLAKEGYEFYWTWSYVLAQVLVIFPSLVWVSLKKKMNPSARLLSYFAWGPLVFFFLTSFKGLVEVNWPIIAYPAFFAIAVLGAQKIKPILIAGIFWISLFLILFSHLIRPWIPNAPERIEEFSQFEPIVPVIEQYDPLYASTYQMASWLWYTTKKPRYKLEKMSRFDLFDTFPEATPSQYPFFIAMKVNTSLPVWIDENGLKVSQVATLEKELVIMKVEKP